MPLRIIGDICVLSGSAPHLLRVRSAYVVVTLILLLKLDLFLKKLSNLWVFHKLFQLLNGNAILSSWIWIFFNFLSLLSLRHLWVLMTEAITISIRILHHILYLLILGQTMKIRVSRRSFLVISLITFYHLKIFRCLFDTYSSFNLRWLCTLIWVFLAYVDINILLPGHVLLVHLFILHLHAIAICLRSPVTYGNFIFHFSSGILLLLWDYVLIWVLVV